MIALVISGACSADQQAAWHCLLWDCAVRSTQNDAKRACLMFADSMLTLPLGLTFTLPLTSHYAKPLIDMLGTQILEIHAAS